MTKIRILFYIAKILILFLYRCGTIWFNSRYLKKGFNTIFLDVLQDIINNNVYKTKC